MGSESPIFGAGAELDGRPANLAMKEAPRCMRAFVRRVNRRGEKVKVLNEKGLATHFVSESCAGGGNSVGEALTGERAGWVSSREIHAPLRERRVLRGADAVKAGGRPHSLRQYCEAQRDPARSKTPRMHGITAHGNREIPHSSAARGAADRIAKSKDKRR